MYIDFHVHAYADEIAERAMRRLATTADIKAYTSGKMVDTRKHLSDNKIDYGVLLPIATKPSQETTINNWAIEHNNGNIISFGTIHPDSTQLDFELERIAEAGLTGIKLHPAYQGHYMFEDCMQRIYKKCGELGLMVTLHMGFDPVSERIMHAMPCDLVQMAEKYPETTFIGAHMGGMNNWERVLYYMHVAENVYYDTAFISAFMRPGLFEEMVEAIGEDKILFGSDLPWSASITELDFIRDSKISEEAKRKICGENAARLLSKDKRFS